MDNGKTPELTKAQTVIREAEQAQVQRFNDGLVSLVKETGYAVAPAVIYPNGEIVLLASYLKAHNIQLQSTIQIVKNG